MYNNSEIILATGQNAIFKCQHCAAGVIQFKLNGTLIHYNMIPGGIIIDYSSQEPCGILYIMTITNIEMYNKTTIQCQGVIENGMMDVTKPNTLLVQGKK